MYLFTQLVSLSTMRKNCDWFTIHKVCNRMTREQTGSIPGHEAQPTFYLAAGNEWKRKIQEKRQVSAEKTHSIQDI
jgi:hypothetical protein